MNETFECHWNNVSVELCEEAADFWITEGALRDRSQALLRAEKILVVARGRSGKIIALSTCYREAVPSLGFPMFLLQMFVGKKHRQFGRAARMVVEAWSELNERFRQGQNPDILGILIEVANPRITRLCRDAVWRHRGMEFVYVGKTARSTHLRAWYFSGARIPF